MELISFKSVSIQRDELLVFDKIDLSVSAGEFIYLIGNVGSGKSSLFKSLYAELPIAEGEAKVFEYDLTSMKRRHIPFLRRKLGIIFQDFQLLTDRSVEKNLEFVLKATGWKNKEEITERIKHVLSIVGMENKGYRMPNTLSGGEQQRIVIARALLNSPELIIADEPTGNLDEETSKNIVHILQDICHKNNTAVIMATHNLHLTEMFPSRTIRIKNMKLIENDQVTDNLIKNDEIGANFIEVDNDKELTEKGDSITTNNQVEGQDPFVFLF